MFRSRLCILGIGFLSTVLSLGALAQEGTYVIVSPAPKGVCTSVAGHWEGNVWVDRQEICKYENRSEGALWINDYWSCTASNPDGTCTTWVLVPGHWKTQ